MRNLLRVLRVGAFLLAFASQAGQAHAANCTATTSGNWNTSGTWSCGHTPAPGDVMIIPAGMTVTVSSNLSYSGSAMRVKIYGTLSFVGGGSKLFLPCGSIVEIMTGTGTISGDGSGSSEQIKICGTAVWSVGSDNNAHGYTAYPTGSTLPVGLLSFTAEDQGDAVLCSWRTASETNSDRFELQRGRSLEDMATIAVLQAAGNSLQTQAYQHTDEPPARGLWYYRLLQYDTDGQMNDLGTLVLDHRSSTSIVCAPMPADDHLEIRSSKALSMVEVIDLNGHLVLRERLSADQYRLDVSGLPPGSYVMRASTADEVVVRPVMVER